MGKVHQNSGKYFYDDTWKGKEDLRYIGEFELINEFAGIIIRSLGNGGLNLAINQLYIRALAMNYRQKPHGVLRVQNEEILFKMNLVLRIV